MNLKRNNNLKILVHCAIMIAMAFGLSMIKLFHMPYGGSVTAASLAPIILISCIYGIRWGLGSAFIFSLMKLVTGISDISYVPTAGGVIACIILDYVLAFTVLGLAGIFEKKGQLSFIRTAVGTVIVMAARLFCHLLSGVFIWYELTKEWYADDPTHIVFSHNSWMYSLIYNGSFMLPETAITVVVVLLLIKPMSDIVKKMGFIKDSKKKEM